MLEGSGRDVPRATSGPSLTAGQAVAIPPRVFHQITNIGLGAAAADLLYGPAGDVAHWRQELDGTLPRAGRGGAAAARGRAATEGVRRTGIQDRDWNRNQDCDVSTRANRHHHERRDRAHGDQPAPAAVDRRHPRAGRCRARRRDGHRARAAAGRPQRGEARGARGPRRRPAVDDRPRRRARRSSASPSTSTRRPPTGARTRCGARSPPASTSTARSRSAATLAEALELYRAGARRAGVRHGVVQDKLWLPGIVRAARPRRQRLLRATCSRSAASSATGSSRATTVAPQRPSWNYRAEDGGGIIADMFAHWRYLLDEVFGGVTAVSCLGATHIPQRWDEQGRPYACTADDAAYATFELEGGGVAQFNSSWCVRVRRDDLLTIQVDGTTGSAVAGLRRCWAQPAAATPRPVWNPDEDMRHDYRVGLAARCRRPRPSATRSRSSGSYSCATWPAATRSRGTCSRARGACSWRSWRVNRRGRGVGAGDADGLETMTSRRVALVTGGHGASASPSRGGSRRRASTWRCAACGRRRRSPSRSRTCAGTAPPRSTCACDVGDRSHARRLVDAVREHFGRLHVLVNNAGVAPAERRDLLEATEESFERVLGVNLRGPYFLTQAAARWMIEQKRHDRAFAGCIVNVSSISATVASTNRGEYLRGEGGPGDGDLALGGPPGRVRHPRLRGASRRRSAPT